MAKQGDHNTVARVDRLLTIHGLLRGGGAVPIERFLRALSVSLATFKRDLDLMRLRLDLPIVWDGDERGYRLNALATQHDALAICPDCKRRIDQLRRARV